jgi:hypothetical protein
MGTTCTKAEVRAEEDPSKEMVSYDEIIAKNMKAIEDIHKQKARDKTFPEFMSRRGKIDIRDRMGKISLNSVRTLNMYRDEWVYIQMQDEWAGVLKVRRETINDVTKYASIYKKDMKAYEAKLEDSIKKLLDYHGVKRKEYNDVIQGNFILENNVSDIVWSYYAFPDALPPKLLEKKELIETINLQAKIAETNKDNIALLTKGMADVDKLDLSLNWVGDKMFIEHKKRFEDFYLSVLDKRRIQDEEVNTQYENFLKLVSPA